MGGQSSSTAKAQQADQTPPLEDTSTADSTQQPQILELIVNGNSSIVQRTHIKQLNEYIYPAQSRWNLLFSSEQSGLSLAALTEAITTKYQGYSDSITYLLVLTCSMIESSSVNIYIYLLIGPCILIVRDKKGTVFGAYASSPFTMENAFSGDTSCFLFKVLPDSEVCTRDQKENEKSECTTNDEFLPPAQEQKAQSGQESDRPVEHPEGVTNHHPDPGPEPVSIKVYQGMYVNI